MASTPLRSARGLSDDLSSRVVTFGLMRYNYIIVQRRRKVTADMTESFDPVSAWLIATVIEILMVPLMLFVFKRMVGKRLDTFDQKRDDAREQAAAERRLTLAMARSQLLENYERCMEKGYYTVDEREVYHELYDAYHRDGGNGIMDALAEKITKLPTEPSNNR